MPVRSNSLKRRDALRLFGAFGIAGLTGCGSLRANPARAGATIAGTPGSCLLTAQETEGPFPLLALLGNSKLLRRDMTEDKAGVPLRLNLTLLDVGNGCAPIAGAAIYVWHCDKDGVYSGYDGQTGGVDASSQTFLRAIQLTDSNGQVVFSTIYPGWYEGRITHIHVQAYLRNQLTVGATATTQLAFPQAVTTEVYDSPLYRARGQNSSVTSFTEDNVFSDGVSTEMLSISGDPRHGYSASMTIGLGTSAGN